MVSLSMEDSQSAGGGGEPAGSRLSSGTLTASFPCSRAGRDHLQTDGLDQMDADSSSNHTFQQQQPALDDNSSSSSSGDGQPDDDQLRRILMCKRLSEGCNRIATSAPSTGSHNFAVNRKNSLHMIGEELPPLTEGEPMRHQSYHFSQNMETSLASSSGSSGSLRSGGGGARHQHHHQQHQQPQLGLLLAKRSSQDDNNNNYNYNNSCSSSASLDGSGGPRSPSRRRSSTVSQCSSVLSEGTRQQLNFDLSPDLGPDASLTEANAMSPTDFERPASPEPSSLSGESSFDATRPVSRMSHECNPDDELMMAASPDSTLGDSNDGHPTGQHRDHRQLQRRHRDPAARESSPPAAQLASIIHSVSGFGETHHSVTPYETNGDDDDDGDDDLSMIRAEHHRRALMSENPGSRQHSLDQQQHHETVIRDNLERLISDVSTVKVSSNQSDDIRAQRQPAVVAITQSVAQKRAHTPFETVRQRSKSSPKSQLDTN